MELTLTEVKAVGFMTLGAVDQDQVHPVTVVEANGVCDVVVEAIAQVVATGAEVKPMGFIALEAVAHTSTNAEIDVEWDVRVKVNAQVVVATGITRAVGGMEVSRLRLSLSG